MKLIPDKWEPLISDREYLLLLMKPQFIKKKGLVILKSHYDPKIFMATWMPFIHDHPSDTARLENTINHVHLSDITGNTELQKEIGEYLSRIWRNKLKSQFPGFRFETKLEFDNDEWELQLWTKHNQTARRNSKK